MPLSLPFNKSSLQGRVLEFTFQTITHGQIGVDQTFSKKCHGFFEEEVEVRRAMPMEKGAIES